MSRPQSIANSPQRRKSEREFVPESISARAICTRMLDTLKASPYGSGTMIPHWLSTENIWFSIGAYLVSYLELFATATGMISVWLATRNSILTWPTGLVSVCAFFLLFYQVQLYSDMVLQAYFFVTSVGGWILWSQRRQGAVRPITRLSWAARGSWAGAALLGTAALGAFMSRVHIWWPRLFPEPAAFPYPDAFTTVLSVIATLLLCARILECWWLWITVDIVSMYLYFQKNINVVAVEYLVFLGMAIYGLYRWRRQWMARRTSSLSIPETGVGETTTA